MNNLIVSTIVAACVRLCFLILPPRLLAVVLLAGLSGTAYAQATLDLGYFGSGIVDGSAPFNTDGHCTSDTATATPGDDCGEHNGQVRTQDTVAHTWSITANNFVPGQSTLDNVTLEQTLHPTSGAVIDFEQIPVICTSNGSTQASKIVHDSPASGDVTLICNLGSFTEGQQRSFNTSVKVSGLSPNGSSYTSDQKVYARDNAGNDVAVGKTLPASTAITISGAPRYDLAHSLNSTQSFNSRDIDKRDVGHGVEAGYVTYMLVRVATNRKTGVEAITQPIQFQQTMSSTRQDGSAYALEYHITDCWANVNGWGEEVHGKETDFPTSDPTHSMSVINSGKCTYTRSNPADPSSSYAFTISGANLSGTRYPIKTIGGQDLTAGPYYSINQVVQVFIPFRSIDMVDGVLDGDGTVTFNSLLSGFDPSGAGGSSNYGAGVEPGYDGAPMADGTRSNNRLGSATFKLESSGSHHLFTMGRTDNTHTYANPLPTQTILWKGGEATAAPGGAYFYGEPFHNYGSTNLHNPMRCTVFDNTVSQLATRDKVGASADGVYAFLSGYKGLDPTKYVVEYGHADLSGDDPLDYNHDGVPDYNAATGRYRGDWSRQGTVRCNDATAVGGWFTDPKQVPGGLDAVNMVRGRLKNPTVDAFEPTQESEMDTPLVVRDTFNGGPHAGQAIPNGTILVGLGSARSDEWYPNWLDRHYIPEPHNGADDGDRVTLSRALIHLDSESVTPLALPGNSASTLAGKPITWKINVAANGMTGAVARNLQVYQTLPTLVSYNAACTLATAGGTPPSLVEFNTDKDGASATGQTRLTWNLGDITVGTAIPPRIICTDTSPMAPNNSSVISHSEVRADNTPIVPTQQKDDHTIRLEQTGEVQVSQAVDMSLDNPNDTQQLSMTWANYSGAYTINAPTIISVLPHMSGGGDGNGLSPRSPASNFHGALALKGVPTITWLDGSTPTATDPNPALGSWYYTADAPETVQANPDTNTSTWCSQAQFGSAGCPANFAAVTALKFASNYALEKDGSPRQGMKASFSAQAGDPLNPASATANQAGDGYTWGFTLDSTSLPAAQFLRSNNVWVQIASYSLGDLIFGDFATDGKFDAGTDFPVPNGVTVELHNASSNALVATTTTGTLGAGRYLFSQLPAGDYYVSIPPSEFQPGGKLAGWGVSVVPSGALENNDQNENVDQHGVSSNPAAQGVRTGSITLSANPPPPGGAPSGNEPLNDNSGGIVDTTGDDFSNLTLDIGLRPAFPMIGITSPDKVSVPENTTGVVLDVATAGGSGAPVFSLSGTDSAWFTIDPTNGEIRFKAPPNYEAPQDADGDNAYLLLVQAQDNTGLTAMMNVTVTVQNQPPAITSTNPSTFAENGSGIVLTVTAVDPNGTGASHLTYNLPSMFDSGLFNIDPVSGEVRFNSPPDYETPKDSNADNVYILMVQACDSGNLCTEQVEIIVVTDVKENAAPTITSDGGGDTAALNLAEGLTAVTAVQATDPDGDALTYSISNGDDAALFQIDPLSGKLSFKTVPDFEHPADANADGQYAVTVTVQDKAGLTDSQALAINVLNGPEVKLQVRGLLQGAYVSKDGMMNDSLRTLGLIPTVQPYGSTDMPFAYQGTETAAPALLAMTGNDAPVDWVLVELRDPNTPKNRVAAMAGLLQRDGDVVDATSGSPTLTLEDVASGQYYVSLRHRNHLGVTTAAPVDLSTAADVDFTLPATATLGNNARLASGTTALMWAGDANSSDSVIASGPVNDVNSVLGRVLSDDANTLVNSNFRLPGYLPSDLNMDGVSVFSGPGNDINLLLGNVLLHPANAAFAANFIIKGSTPK